eukprot:gene4407-1643_t
MGGNLELHIHSGMHTQWKERMPFRRRYGRMSCNCGPRRILRCPTVRDAVTPSPHAGQLGLPNGAGVRAGTGQREGGGKGRGQ